MASEDWEDWDFKGDEAKQKAMKDGRRIHREGTAGDLFVGLEEMMTFVGYEWEFKGY